MIYGDSDTIIITIISRIKYSYKDVSIRYEFSLSDGSLTFYLQLGDKAVKYPIPRYELVYLTPDDLYEKLNDLVKHEFNCKKEEDMTHNLGTLDSLATKIVDRQVSWQRNGITTTAECINRILSDTLCKPMVKKIIKSGPCTIVIWEDGTKTIVRLREGETYDEYTAFTAALAKKIYGSNSSIAKMIEKKTFVQEKEGSQEDVIPKMLRDLGEAIKKKAPVQEKKEV